MKRVLLAMLMLILCLSMIVSCGSKSENKEEAKDPSTPSQSETNPPEEEPALPGTVASLHYGGYNISNVGSPDVKLAKGENYKYAINGDDAATLLTLYPITGLKGTPSNYICFGDEAEIRLTISTPIPGKEPSVQTRRNNRSEQFVFVEQADGTYLIRSSYSDKIVLGYEDGKIVNQEFDASNKNQYWSVTRIDYPQTTYKEWVSAKGDIFLRLPLNILEVADTTSERMQIFADDIQKMYEAYIELTGYTPYPAIVVKGDAKQGVMAGVVDGCNTIFINYEWYVEDMAKMQKRWEDGKRDFNFCVLHEMGHMFDSGRGWNFESEMEADLKAVYVLYKHQNDDRYGAWAAPAEFPAVRCFNYETISKAYDELGADMEKEYSFYGAAQLFTELVYETGWEPLMKTFHYFQDENILASQLKPIERFNTFVSKWDEYTDVDVIAFIGGKKMTVLTAKFSG